MMKESGNDRLRVETIHYNLAALLSQTVLLPESLFTQSTTQHNQTNTNIHNTLLISSPLGAIMP